MWFNTILGAIAFFALVAMANYFASGYFKRFQVSANSRLDMTSPTKALLQKLTNQVEVTIFYDQQGNEEMYGLVSGLLKQYSYANANLTVRSLDYTRSPAKAAALLAKHKLTTPKEKNLVIFESGGRSKVVFGNELYDYDLNSVLSGQSTAVRRNAFKGELLFSSALFAVTYPRQAKAYFVYGHGEHDPDNSGSDQGYSRFASILQDENNIPWQKISLRSTNDIPEDCQLLVIAGPAKASFDDSELAKIESYLKQGRRLFVLLNNAIAGNDSGIEKVLAKWNIGVVNYTLEDTRFTLDGADIVPAQVKGDHPIFKSIVSEGLQIYLLSPRTVFFKPLPTAAPGDVPQFDILAATSTNAVGRYKTPGPTGTVEAREQHGMFPLIVAVEQGSIKNITTERGVTRLIVIGDSLCFDNQNINTLANHLFANAVVNWLVDRPQMLVGGIGPRPIKEYKLVLPTAQMKRLSWILLGAMPGAVLLLGLIVWLRRRH